ncbi:MAG: gliding motility-associated C-terminal domain-containing protein [Bacteroidetes bacterium]|nr:MAG: gliding motility-associated C-terminal domain-containing protein [Bacteroidota bacterium]
MLIPPIDFGCVGVAFYHNPGAFDMDGDSIGFEFVTPRKAVGTPVDNYRDIHDPSFGGTVETGNSPATLTIDNVTGDIVWNSPGMAGTYNIAFRVLEYRKVQGQYFLMGTVVRDMQIIIDDCDNARPKLEIPDDLCVEAGTKIQEVIRATDADGDPVKIEVLSAILHFPNSPATYTPYPPNFQPQPGEVIFNWQTTCDHIREQPYLVHFKVSDNPEQGVSLVEFGTMNIIVVAPSPKGLTNQVNSDRTIDLSWDAYNCGNADSIQIWRRIDSFIISRDVCDVGMPPNTGYELIDKVSSSVNTYKDDNNGKKLAFGADYCYRLVAQFPAPSGGESYVSDETCGIIKADGPIITHVTVDETDETDGKITISWRGPFEIDQVLFPPPYKFELWLGEGLSGALKEKVMSIAGDTTIQITGLNTAKKKFNFLVKLFDGSGAEVRQSVGASQVDLEPVPLLEKIELVWDADVPWTNNSQTFPMHYIYRDHVVAGNPTQIVLYDSVNVNINGFKYLDDREALSDQILYCYKVETLGTYGNPNIVQPQRNFSQRICASPNDIDPPGPPKLGIEFIDCEEFLADKDCNYSVFFNILIWEPNIEPDLKGYKIYFSTSGEEGTFVLIDFVENDETFLHDGLSSFKGCYYITAVDRSNNESEPSGVVCNDNCPYYKLPNIITPNGDGVNDTFRPLDENSTDIGAQCPRFIESVNFKVFNRWGVEQYAYTSGGENSIYINWDGRDAQGQLLQNGMYFYSADVVFNVLNKEEREKTLSGWVQILY